MLMNCLHYFSDPLHPPLRMVKIVSMANDSNVKYTSMFALLLSIYLSVTSSVSHIRLSSLLHIPYPVRHPIFSTSRSLLFAVSHATRIFAFLPSIYRSFLSAISHITSTFAYLIYISRSSLFVCLALYIPLLPLLHIRIFLPFSPLSPTSLSCSSVEFFSPVLAYCSKIRRAMIATSTPQPLFLRLSCSPVDSELFLAVLFEDPSCGCREHTAIARSWSGLRTIIFFCFVQHGSLRGTALA